MITRLFFVLFFILPAVVIGQIVLDNAPPSLHWFQINTEDFKIIFPKGYNTVAMRVANTMQHLYKPVSSSLKTEPKKLSVILQNRNAVSNGFVTLAPWRTEFFTMPPQEYKFLGTNDWLDLLAVHEFRHVVQNDKSIVGFNKLIYWLLGESALSGMGFASVPIWFDEGDAVGMETALTHSGRGRMPSFNMALRAAYLEQGPYNYHKQYLRSFKDFVPNHYVLGYHLSTYLRNSHQDEKNIWEPITLNAYKYSFLPFNFSNSIKKYTGKRVVKTYNAMARQLVDLWKKQIAGLSFRPFTRVNHRKNNVFTNYDYPHVLEDGSVVALKSGLSDIKKFILISADGSERNEFTPGVINDPGYVTVGGDLIVWTEYAFDPRWAKQAYSVVKTYNLKTKKYTSLTHHTRFSGAAVSPDGVRIAVVNNQEQGLYQIMIISANMGIVLKALTTPSSAFYSMPHWSDDGRYIAVLKHSRKGKAVVRINVETSEEEVLVDYSRENIGYPVLYKNYLFYNSAYNGIDNIYALDLETGSKSQVTLSKYGAFNPSFAPDGSEIYYNDFTKDGMDIVKIPFDPSAWTPVENVEIRRVDYFQSLVEQENNPDVLSQVPDKHYPVTPYSKGKQLLNINSWGPYFNTSVFNYNIGIFFRDVLSINNGFLGYEYNVDEMAGKWKFDYSYQGFYPIIDFTASTGSRKATEKIKDSTDVIRDVDFDWKESGFRTGVRVPLNLTNSKYATRLTVGEFVGYNYISDFTNDYTGDNRLFLRQQGNGKLVSNEFEIVFSNFLKKSKRDIRSRWGQYMVVNALSTPYGGDYDGGLFATTGLLFFPGIFKHHSTNFLVGYQTRKITLAPDNYTFSGKVPFLRGYGSSVWNKFITLRTNYEFTLWNADLAIGPVLNIQRIRTKLFYDIAHGEIDVTNRELNRKLEVDFDYQSFGGELWFDFNIMRLLPLLSGGVRAVYIQDVGLNFEIVIGNIQI